MNPTCRPSQALLKSCGSWSAVEDALQQLGLGQLEPFLQQNLGRHNAPTSPVVSVVLNILNADLWRQCLGVLREEQHGTSYHHPDCINYSITMHKLSDLSGLRLCPDFFPRQHVITRFLMSFDVF